MHARRGGTGSAYHLNLIDESFPQGVEQLCTCCDYLCSDSPWHAPSTTPVACAPHNCRQVGCFILERQRHDVVANVVQVDMDKTLLCHSCCAHT